MLILKNSEKRFWEIDFLRGVAIILMIIFILLLICLILKNTTSIFLKARGVILANLFLSLSFFWLVFLWFWAMHERKSREKKKLIFKYLKKGLKIFSWGLALTFITYLFMPHEYIVFGVLHFIGLSVILAYPFYGLSIRIFLSDFYYFYRDFFKRVYF